MTNRINLEELRNESLIFSNENGQNYRIYFEGDKIVLYDYDNEKNIIIHSHREKRGSTNSIRLVDIWVNNTEYKPRILNENLVYINKKYKTR